MADTPTMAADPVYGIDAGRTYESSASAMSWGAILGGAMAAVALTVVLLALGAGFGLASISPWANAGASVVGFTISAGIALIVIQWLSSALGGYLTGRMRTKWTATHTDEVWFRDSAHGFLSWAVATVIGALVVGSAVSSAIGTGTQAAASVASGAAQGASTGAMQMLQNQHYGIDMLFRGGRPEAAATSAEARTEAGRILLNGLRAGEIPAADKTYLADMIAARTGLPPAEAQARVDAAIAQAKAAEIRAREVADVARKSTAAAAIMTALAMLIGAFVASAAAAFGGSQRDDIEERATGLRATDQRATNQRAAGMR